MRTKSLFTMPFKASIANDIALTPSCGTEPCAALPCTIKSMTSPLISCSLATLFWLNLSQIFAAISAAFCPFAFIVNLHTSGTALMTIPPSRRTSFAPSPSDDVPLISKELIVFSAKMTGNSESGDTPYDMGSSTFR